MAVEIPVVIDVDKAFKEAAARVSKDMKPLQEQMDQNALQIRINIDSEHKLTVKQVLDDATLSAKDLRAALADIDAQISRRAAAGGFDLSKGLVYSEKIMLQAAGALEAKINGVKDGSAIMARIFSANIDKAKNKIDELTEKINRLTIQQNKYNIETKKNSPGARLNYANYTRRIEEANTELVTTRKRLGDLTIELDKISGASKVAANNMRLMKAPAMQMADEWRRGAEYVQRYNAGLGVANLRLVSLLKSAVALAGLHAATSFVRNVREVTAEFEMQRVALGGIINDTEEAERLFKRIKAAAIQSPFEIKDLVTFTKQLSAYRIETENLFDVTMKLADVSAGLGVDMNRLVLAYGQVRAAAVLRGQELRQFTEAGIPLVELLAEKFRQLGREGTTTADVFQLISERAVPFKMIEEIFDDMTSAGGVFYKMQEKQSETLKGQWMKLKDALSIMYDEIGNTGTVHNAMESLIKDSMVLMQNWRKVGNAVSVVVASLAAYKVALINARVAANALTLREAASLSAIQLNVIGRSKLITALFGEAAATKAQIVVGNAYVRMKKREMIATNLFTRSLYKMAAAFLAANWYAIAIAGIAALVTIIYKFIKASNEAKVTSDDLQKSIANFSKAKETTDDVNKLCDAYDELSSKAERTKEEEEKLARVTKELAKSYPSAVTGAEDHARAMKLDTDAIKERNAAVQEAIRLSLIKDKESVEKQADALRSEYDKIAETIARGTIERSWTHQEGNTTTWFEPLSEKEKERLVQRLLEIESELGKFNEAINNAEKELDEFKGGMIGPPTPEFFGDEWRFKINQYSVWLNGATSATKAFSSLQIQQFGSVEEAVGQAAQEYQKLSTSVDFYDRVLKKVTGAQKVQLEGVRDNLKLQRDMYAQILTDYDAWSLVKKNTTSTYTQDPFIKLMQERMKFMKDFKRGYDDLSKYLMSDAALEKEFGYMQERGFSLSLDAAEQKRAANDLSQWYQDAIDKAFDKLKEKHNVSGTWREFLSQQITGDDNRSKMLRDFQNLMQSLLDAKTDYDVSEQKKSLEDALKRLSEEVKNSEQAKNFYENILGLTGDKQLAASLSLEVYGNVGDDFKNRIQRELRGAFDVLKPEESAKVTDSLRRAIDSGDVGLLMKNIADLPESLATAVRNAAEATRKYNADIANDYTKLLMKFDEVRQQTVDIEKKADESIRTLRQGLALEIDGINQNAAIKDKQAAIDAAEARVRAVEEGIEREKQVELFKLSRDYRTFFNSVGVMSKKAARATASAYKKMITEQFEQGEISLSKFKREWNEVEEQLRKYEDDKNPLVEFLSKGIDGLVKKLSEYSDSLRATAGTVKDGDGFFNMNEDTMDYIDKMGSMFGGEMFGVSGRKNVFAKMMAEYGPDADAWEEALNNGADKLSNLSKDFAAGIGWADFWVNLAGGSIKAFDQIAQKSKNTEGEVKEGWNKVAKFIITSAAGMLVGVPITAGLAGQNWDVDDAWERFTGLNEKAMSGFEKFKQGDIIGALIDNIEGWAEVFGINTKKIDRQIKQQSELIEDLQYEYNRLGVAIEDAFGTEYISNYNQQMESLKAQAEAYRKQAELERSKDKKSDEEKAKEYDKKARDVEDQIADARGQLAEFFTGTDLTSAAKDFAQAWIDAYQEFGSTASAIKEKFNDMIEEMVINSLAAQLIQGILKPIFDQIDEAASDGALTAEEMASIAALVPSAMAQIDNGMTGLMNQLTAAGINLRQQAGTFSGISRDIATASEESITGLAAGINTQNFYISHIDQNVALILSVLTSGTTTEQASVTGQVADPYKDAMLDYASHIPTIDENLATLLRKFNSVIVNVSGQNRVAIQ